MKKQFSLALAIIMLCCSVLSSGITAFASIKMSEAKELELYQTYTIKTKYDSSEDYETSHCWGKIKTGSAGAYVFNIDCDDEDSFIVPFIFKTKKAAENLDVNSVFEVSGAIVDDESLDVVGYVYDLPAEKTYYVDFVCVNFDDAKAEPKIQLSITTHNHNYKSYSEKAETDGDYSRDGHIGKQCKSCYAEKVEKTIPYAKTFTLSKTSYVYDGKTKKPSVTVKDRKGKVLTKDKDYTVTYPSASKNVGSYTVKIKLKGNYSGTVKKTFKIVPKGTTVSSVSAGKKSFTVKWKKQATQTTGYEIQYSTDKNFKKGNKTVTVSKNGTTSKTVSKLTAKKKYYVRVRTYKTVSGKKYYSSWSGSKSVTTKK